MADEKTYLALADEHKWKSYNDLSQIGITSGSETINDIIVAMPEGSELSYAISASQHNQDAYPYPTGTITFKKYSDSACDVEHVCSANNEYRGTWRMYAVGSGNVWLLSDWIQVFDAVNKVPVQNGGLYINSETTEEDKAEAKNALEEIGFHLKIAQYSFIGQIGLSGSVTMDDVINALPDFSELKMANNTAAFANNVSDVPAIYGLLIVTKIYANYCYAKFIVSEANGNVTEYERRYHSNSGWTDWKQVFFADGSVSMSGDLKLGSGTGHVGSVQSMTVIAHNNEDETVSYVSICENNMELAKQLRFSVSKDYGMQKFDFTLFGEHNKPTGTYAGNGGSQTIDTGGVGDVILVQLTGSGGGMALVSKSGAIGKLNSNNSVFALADTEAKFIDGVLTLNSSNYGVNRSGYGYNWQVL